MSEEIGDRLVSLLDAVTAVRHDVAEGGRSRYRDWEPRITREAFAAAALNFGHYLALRRLDLRELQHRLMVLGLSSLGRSESRVLTTLDAIRWALARMLGQDLPDPPSERQFFRGEQQLRDNAEELFGPSRDGRRGRIMVTLGPEAADDPGFVASLAGHGVDIVRINCGHDDAETWQRMIDNTRLASSQRPLRILMDIAGPKVRMEEVATPPDRTRLVTGDRILLCRDIDADGVDFPFRATCAPKGVLDRLTVGDAVSIDDAKLHGTVVAEAAGGFAVDITGGRTKGLKLRPGRGLNFPAVDLKLDPLTDKDRCDLDFVCAHADLIGHSFVQSADNVAALQRELAARRADWRRIGLVAKIETPIAVSNLPEIIVQAAGIQPLGVMIARGDLAVELGFERLAEMQEEILWLCEAAAVPAIWATQVLEDLVKEGMPSRGEMTDAAMSARAECVMLNKGPNVVAAVATLDRLLRRMGEHQIKKTPTLRALHSWAYRTTPR